MRTCFDRGQWDEGIALCSRALESDPFATHAYYHRALALEQIGKHDEGERDLRRVLYLDRNHALAHFQLGRLLIDVERRSEAAPLLRITSRLLANRPDAEPAGAESDLTVGELRALLCIHTGKDEA